MKSIEHESPARTVGTQSDYLFASLFVYVKLGQLKLAHQLNHFALKTKLYQATLKAAFQQLAVLKLNANFA